MNYSEVSPFRADGEESRTLVYLGSSDPTNEYDNYMVLQGSLWVKENHRLVTRERAAIGADYPHVYDLSEAVFSPTGNTRLTAPIDAASVEFYGVWKQNK